jgi:[acyl-carrier-protein] S-malonyltransferase
MNSLAFVFPGQGSQFVGMLGEDQPVVAGIFDEASSVLGYDLWELVQIGPVEKLNQTEFTQPALLTASVALWRMAQDRGIELPGVVAGHSLGEYSALVAAGVISFPDAVSLVQKRGRLMQTAVPNGEGSMAAVIGLPGDVVSEICDRLSTDGVVEAANFNSAAQVVIAGQNKALEAAIEACKEAGAKRVIPLDVSAPFHCSLMQPAAEKMRLALAEVTFNSPQLKVIQNVNALYCDDTELIRDNLVGQMYSAVRWTDTINKMTGNGVMRVVECGPGKVLSGLNRRIDKSLASFNINSLKSLQSVAEEFGS